MASDAVDVFDPVDARAGRDDPDQRQGPERARAQRRRATRSTRSSSARATRPRSSPYAERARAAAADERRACRAAPQQGMIVAANDPAVGERRSRTRCPTTTSSRSTPTTFAVTRYFTGVGTTNFDLAVAPATGTLYVANTDARNLVRFEPVLRGHAIDSRVTTITTGVVAGRDAGRPQPGRQLQHAAERRGAVRRRSASRSAVVIDAAAATALRRRRRHRPHRRARPGGRGRRPHRSRHRRPEAR